MQRRKKYWDRATQMAYSRRTYLLKHVEIKACTLRSGGSRVDNYSFIPPPLLLLLLMLLLLLHSTTVIIIII